MRNILVLIGLTFLLSACANVSRLERNSLVAHGSLLDGSTDPLYYTIWIYLDNSIDERTTSALLKLSPESPPVVLADLHPELVSAYLPRFIPPPQWPEAWKQKENESESYSGGGFYIKFEEEQAVFVGICSHCSDGREYPIVGTPDGLSFYTLPLTEQQITDVFGSPDRIYKVGEVRYGR